MVFLWCFCAFVVVFLYVSFGQGSTFVALPRSYAKRSYAKKLCKECKKMSGIKVLLTLLISFISFI